MTRWAIVIVVLSSAGGVSPQLAMHGAFQAERVELEIEAVERQREEALVRKDMKALERIYDDDYTLITLSGEVQNKAQLLERIRTAALVVESMERSEVQLRVYGDVAVQTSLDAFRMRGAGTSSDGRKRVTRVYVKRSSGWRLAHVHDTLVAE